MTSSIFSLQNFRLAHESSLQISSEDGTIHLAQQQPCKCILTSAVLGPVEGRIIQPKLREVSSRATSVSWENHENKKDVSIDGGRNKRLKDVCTVESKTQKQIYPQVSQQPKQTKKRRRVSKMYVLIPRAENVER